MVRGRKENAPLRGGEAGQRAEQARERERVRVVVGPALRDELGCAMRPMPSSSPSLFLSSLGVLVESESWMALRVSAVSRMTMQRAGSRGRRVISVPSEIDDDGRESV